MIRDNEPRFLRQVGFPATDDELAVSVARLAGNELQADLLLSDIDEYSAAADYFAEVANALDCSSRTSPRTSRSSGWSPARPAAAPHPSRRASKNSRTRPGPCSGGTLGRT